MGKPNIIIAINSDNYEKTFIENLSNIFPNCDLHLGFMGETTVSSEIKKIISKNQNVKTNIEIKSACYFNYSFTTNVLLKNLNEKNKDKDSIVVLTDSWSVFSIYQPLYFEFKKFDFSENFIKINILFDDSEKVQFDNKKISTTISSRIKSIVKEEENLKKLERPPILICSLSGIIEICNGLEEELFTENSRIQLINQLKKAGLNEFISESLGLNINLSSLNEVSSCVLNRDIQIINEITNKLDFIVFISNNLNVNWGVINKIEKLKLNKKRIPEWFLEHKSSISRIRTEIDRSYVDKFEIGNEEDEEEDDSKITFDLINNDAYNQLDKNKPALILVTSDLKDLISITPLIKELYLNCQHIDILTDDKLNLNLSFIKNFMIKNIYSYIAQYSLNQLDISKYGSNIIRTKNCHFKIETDKIIFNPTKLYKFQTLTNFSSIKPDVSKIPDPFITTKEFKRWSSQCTILIANSIKKDSIVLGQIPNYKILVSKISNISEIKIVLLSLINEINVLNEAEYKLKKNISFFNVNEFEASGFVKNSNLFITHSETLLNWIAFGCKAKTFNLKIQEGTDDIPPCSWFENIKSEKLNFDQLFNDFWRKF